MTFSLMKRIFLIFSVWAAGGCSPGLQPARPEQIRRLHARITEVELRMSRDDASRRDRLEETVRQTRELDAIAAERFAFSNAVARVWAQVNQEIDTLSSALDLTVQSIDYLEKSLSFHHAKLAKAWRDFQLDQNDRAAALREMLCGRKPDSSRCAKLNPAQEHVP